VDLVSVEYGISDNERRRMFLCNRILLAGYRFDGAACKCLVLLYNASC